MFVGLDQIAAPLLEERDCIRLKTKMESRDCQFTFPFAVSF